MAAQARARRIAVIGAGASGLAAAKYLLAEQAFDTIDVFEQGGNVGGLWQATPDFDEEETFHLPSVTPSKRPDKPKWHERRSPASSGNEFDRSSRSGATESPNTQETAGPKQPVFVSPIYDRLETNIPRSLMRFSDHYFADGTQLFPKHETVQRYIEDYAREVRHLVKFETQVLDVRLHHTREHDSEHYRDVWEVQTLHLRSGSHSVDIYDAVVCANGHYATPYVPEVPGLEEWATLFPGSVSHAKYYRRPEAYQGKKVLIVGNFASGSDISNQILPFCQQPLLVSARSASELFAASPTKREFPQIARFDAATHSIFFENGHREEGVENVIFCTGYLYSYPFLQSLQPSLVTDGAYVRNTYQHLFYAPHPTLTLLALPQKVIPFPISEAQAAVVARYYAGRLSLPSYEQMRQWEQQRLDEASSSGITSKSKFHKMPFPADAEYINMLCDWAAAADGAVTVGKSFPRWGEWERWCRGRFPDIKKAYNERGEQRSLVTSLEELGFDYDRWKSEQDAGSNL